MRLPFKRTLAPPEEVPKEEQVSKGKIPSGHFGNSFAGSDLP